MLVSKQANCDWLKRWVSFKKMSLIQRIALVWSCIQNRDTYLWLAAVSILDTSKEKCREILLFGGSSFLSAAQTGINRLLTLVFAAASLSAVIEHQGKQLVYISEHLSWSIREETLPEPRRSAPPPSPPPVPPRRAFPALRCTTAAWLKVEQPLCCSSSGEEQRFFPSEMQRRKRGVWGDLLQVAAADDDEGEEKRRKRINQSN